MFNHGYTSDTSCQLVVKSIAVPEHNGASAVSGVLLRVVMFVDMVAVTDPDSTVVLRLFYGCSTVHTALFFLSVK